LFSPLSSPTAPTLLRLRRRRRRRPSELRGYLDGEICLLYLRAEIKAVARVDWRGVAAFALQLIPGLGLATRLALRAKPKLPARHGRPFPAAATPCAMLELRW
ncbi:hypothetical protein U9M48_016811, partial [Paspalum notatum var. saurae]